MIPALCAATWKSYEKLGKDHAITVALDIVVFLEIGTIKVEF